MERFSGVSERSLGERRLPSCFWTRESSGRLRDPVLVGEPLRVCREWDLLPCAVVLWAVRSWGLLWSHMGRWPRAVALL
jgi:hypothetical protein